MLDVLSALVAVTILAVTPCTLPVKKGLCLGAFASKAGRSRSLVALATDVESAVTVAMLSVLTELVLVGVML